jgi:hypothetical protein
VTKTSRTSFSQKIETRAFGTGLRSFGLPSVGVCFCDLSHAADTPGSAAALHQRPIIAVYHHMRRIRNPMRQGEGGTGAWTPEQDQALLQ